MLRYTSTIPSISKLEKFVQKYSLTSEAVEQGPMAQGRALCFTSCFEYSLLLMEGLSGRSAPRGLDFSEDTSLCAATKEERNPLQALRS